KRSYLQTANFELGLELVQRDTWLTAGDLRLDEDIVVDTTDVAYALRIGIDRDLFVREVVEAAQIVHPEDAVGVGMGDEDGIHPTQVIGKCLKAQFRCRIHKDYARF